MKNILFITIFVSFLTLIIVGINPKIHKKVQIQSVNLSTTIYNSNAKEKGFAIQNKDTGAKEKNIVFENKYSDVKEQEFAIENKDALDNKNNVNTKNTNVTQQANNISKKDIELENKWQQLLAIAKEDELRQERLEKNQKQSIQKSNEHNNRKSLKNFNSNKNLYDNNQSIGTSEENIAWNKWRADVSNNIAMSLEAQGFANMLPPGTQYFYSFRVSKQGQITNVSVNIISCNNNSTTQHGAELIKEAIKSFNYSPILTFPRGSQRNSVNVLSGIQISLEETRYLSDDAYHDIEKIRKYYYK